MAHAASPAQPSWPSWSTSPSKQRRKEYGVLLAMGEKKSKLIAQQALEIVVVAAVAIGLSSLFART
ncbi:hypothetical protein LV779_21865 [Streptomyces thinghirensis]|nr:hypothetical protein [Streptomyces thinghirensis]